MRWYYHESWHRWNCDWQRSKLFNNMCFIGLLYKSLLLSYPSTVPTTKYTCSMHFKTTNNQPTPPTPTTSTSLYPTTFGSLRAMHQCPLTNTQHSRWKGFRCGDQFTSCTNACGSGQSGDWKSSSDGNRLLCALVFFIQTYFFGGGVGKSNMLVFFFGDELNWIV